MSMLPPDDRSFDAPILELPKLPGDWHFEGRKIVYDGPHTEAWCIFLSALVDLVRKGG